MSIFAKRSLKGILSGFTKVVAELNVLIEENNEAASKNAVKITELQDENTALNTESAEAAAVKANIAQLLNPGAKSS